MHEIDLPKGLKRLDPHFRATFFGSELGELFDPEVTPKLLSSGILVRLDDVTTLRGCICEEGRESCEIHVEETRDCHVAYCNLRGAPFEIESTLVQRYAFEPAEWAERIRRFNNLSGRSAIGLGVLWVGTGTIAGRGFELLITAPTVPAEGLVIPPEAVSRGNSTACLPLGGDRTDLPFDVVLDSSVLRTNLIGLEKSIIRKEIESLPLTAPTTEIAYRVYSDECPKGRLASESDYEALTSARGDFALMVDLVAMGVWRSGRRRYNALDGNRRSTGKPISSGAIVLFSEYMKRPNIALPAADLATLTSLSPNPRSLTNHLNTIRRSISAKRFFKTVARGDSTGRTAYMFQPSPGMKWCVVERA